MPQTKVMTMESRKMTKRWNGMKRTPTTRSFLGEGDLTPSWSIGPTTRSFLFWNLSVHRIKNEITENGENLEQELSMIFSSEASVE